MLLALSVASASSAEALVYWVNHDTGTIGRANLNGRAKQQGFIKGISAFYGVAVNAKHIYWSTPDDWIGRADLDGRHVWQHFIPTAAGGAGAELAIDKRHIYWSNGATGWIGRANLNGSGITQQLIAPQSNAVNGLAVRGKFIYWGDYQNSRIGNGELSILGVNPLFVPTTADRPEGVAVDGGHVYWSNGSDNSIGRAKLNGHGIQQHFIAAGYAYGVEVNRSHIFWANYNTNSIGRAKLNGSGAKRKFIRGAKGPEGVAVDWILNRGAGFRIVRVTRNRKRGTAQLIVKVPGPGKLTLGGKGVRRVKKHAGTARVGLGVRPSGALKHQLVTSGAATTKIRISFHPKLGKGSKSTTRKLSLRR